MGGLEVQWTIYLVSFVDVSELVGVEEKSSFQINSSVV